MNRKSPRPFLILFGSLVLLMLCVGIALAITVYETGVITIDVHSNGRGGDEIHNLRVPALLANQAMEFIPEKAFRDAHRESENVGPMLREFSRALRHQHDFTLVQVEGPNEQVRIRKDGKNLVIDVQDDEEDVHVVVPLSTLDAVAKKLASS